MFEKANRLQDPRKWTTPPGRGVTKQYLSAMSKMFTMSAMPTMSAKSTMSKMSAMSKMLGLRFHRRRDGEYVWVACEELTDLHYFPILSSAQLLINLLVFSVPRLKG